MKIIVNMFLAAVTVPSLCASAFVDETSVAKEFPSKNVKSVRFNSVSAPVSVDASTGPVRVTVSGFDAEKCEFEAEMTGPELKIALKPKKRKTFFGGQSFDCRAGAAVFAPASAEVDVRTVSGKVWANGFSAPVRIGTVSGDSSVEGLSGGLEWTSVSGDLSGSLSGPAEMSTTSGGASLRWVSAPSKIEFGSVSGPGKFVLPKGTAVSASFRGVSGKLRNSLPEGGGVTVRLKTVSGDVELLPAP